MATVEQRASEQGTEDKAAIANGAADAANAIPVENPATGEIVATVPDLGADAVAEMAARGRAAQKEWDAYGFEGRSRVLDAFHPRLAAKAQAVLRRRERVAYW